MEKHCSPGRNRDNFFQTEIFPLQSVRRKLFVEDDSDSTLGDDDLSDSIEILDEKVTTEKEDVDIPPSCTVFIDLKDEIDITNNSKEESPLKKRKIVESHNRKNIVVINV